MWVKWLKDRVEQGCIFHIIIPARYTYFLVKLLLVKLKNLHTSAWSKVNYWITKHKPKMQKLLRWWNLAKLVTDTFVNFGNFFNSIILSPSPHPFSSGKMSSKNAVREEWTIPVCLGDNNKNLGESSAWGHE